VRRVSLEAGRTDGWRGWVGADGLTLGIDSYGASAPDHVLKEKFGLTPTAVKTAIERWLAG
jgi:transketolase